MAIDLPPAIPPQLTTVSQIERFSAGQTAVSGDVNGFDVRITGQHYLTDAEIQSILARAQNPSQAILLLTAATATQGDLLVTTYYAPQHNTVHVHAMQGTLRGAEGSEAVTHYFSGLEGRETLTRAQFDRARVMANVRSERTGIDYSTSYRLDPDKPGDTYLVFTDKPREDHKPWDAFLQLGNQGSRFAGRYMADAGLGYNFGSGTRLAMGYQRSIPEWGESFNTKEYHQLQLRLDHPSRWGLYGIDANRVEYERKLGPFTAINLGCSLALGDICLLTSSNTETVFFDLEAVIDRFGISGEQVISSDVHYRFNLFQRVEYIDSEIKIPGQGVLQDEEYGTLELGARYQRVHAFGDRRLQWGAKASVKGGLSSDNGTLGTDNVSPGVSIGKRSSEFITILPQAMVKYKLSERASLNADFRAQFADEQLPQQQQWVLGGIDTLSAYLPGVLVGDNGYFARGSFDYSWDLGASMKLTASLFAEYGASSYENASRDPVVDPGFNPGSTSSIADAGIGLKLDFMERFELRAVAAESLSEKNVSDGVIERTEVDFFVVLKATF